MQSYQDKDIMLHHEAGISLFEMIIVMAIVASLSYLSISIFSHIKAQRQLIQSVREVIAFLATQRQYALLFNNPIKITLLIAPDNKIIATPFQYKSSSKNEIYQLVAGIELKQTTVKNVTFGHLRQTLKPMSFVIKKAGNEVKIIISSLGRIRVCSQQIKVFSSC